MFCGVGVQSAAVNVICELARKNPKNYLSLAPLFFKLMTSSTNNWVLIKIIKLVGVYLFFNRQSNTEYIFRVFLKIVLTFLCIVTVDSRP